MKVNVKCIDYPERCIVQIGGITDDVTPTFCRDCKDGVYSVILPVDEYERITEELVLARDFAEQQLHDLKEKINDNENNNTGYITCPFCKNDDFDLVGLKHHLKCQCEKYANTKGI